MRIKPEKAQERTSILNIVNRQTKYIFWYFLKIFKQSVLIIESFSFSHSCCSVFFINCSLAASRDIHEEVKVARSISKHINTLMFHDAFKLPRSVILTQPS